MSKILNFIDIETTGSRFGKDQIIEVAVLKVENDTIIDTFESLIKPSVRIDPFATKIHGISNSMLSDSPSFNDIAKKLYDFLIDGTFTAHNARFDFSYVRKQLDDNGFSLQTPYLCTVKLSRHLYPQYKRHGLSHIISRYNIPIDARHRAMGDTKATYDFYQIAKNETHEQIFEAASKKAINQAWKPAKMSTFAFNKIPNSPGIYIFKDALKNPIYIGKSIHLRDRVKSHFYGSSRIAKEMNIASEVANIDFEETVGELGALLREAYAIKALKPKYNVKLTSSYPYGLIKIQSPDGYNGLQKLKVKKSSLEELLAQNILTLHRSKQQADAFINHLVKSGFCENILRGKKGACFAYHLNKCNGACLNKVSAIEHNTNLNKAISEFQLEPWPFEGSIKLKDENTADSEVFTIENWCVKSSNKNIKYHFREFDYDIYRIVKSAVKHY